MQKPEIISLIKRDGTWVNQHSLSEEQMRAIAAEALQRAAASVGYDAIPHAKLSEHRYEQQKTS